MSIDTAKEITRFIRRAMLDDSDLLLRRLELYHAPRGKHASMIWRKEWGTDELEGWIESGDTEHPFKKIESLSNTIVGLANSDVLHFKGKQRYRLIAIDQHGERIGRHFFTMVGSDVGDDDYEMEELEDGSYKAMVKTLLDTNLKLVQASQMGYAQIIDTQARMLSKSQEHIEKLTSERTEMFATVEAAMSQQHERALEEMNARSSIELREKAFKSIKMLAPAVVNRLAGQKVLPAGDPKSLLIDEFLESITTEQAQKLAAAGILDTAQLTVVMELIKDKRDRDSEDED